MKTQEEMPVHDFERWQVVDDIPEEGEVFHLSASDGEKAHIAGALDLLSLDGLEADLELKRRSRGRVSVHGTLKAAVQQACVVTLEPVRADISEKIDTEYWPEEQISAHSDTGEDDEALDLEPLADDGPDPIENGRINLGQLVFETLATSLDPYPRRQDAVFEWEERESGAEGESGDNPFSALQQLKQGAPE